MQYGAATGCSKELGPIDGIGDGIELSDALWSTTFSKEGGAS